MTLRYVDNTAEIRESIARFNASARPNRPRSLKLLRATTFWVLDRETGRFGPAKFVGYSKMNFDVYEAATKGKWSGDRFDGHGTRSAITKAANKEFGADASLAGRLVSWGEELLGPDAFGGAADAKWQFLRV